MCSHRVSGPYRFRDFFCRLGLEIERMREKNREKNRERENERGWQTGHTCGLCYVNLPLCLSPPPADETRRAIGVGRQRVIKFNSWPRIGGSSLLSPRFPSFPGETVGPITDRLEFTWLLPLRSLPDYPPCPKKVWSVNCPLERRAPSRKFYCIVSIVWNVRAAAIVSNYAHLNPMSRTTLITFGEKYRFISLSIKILNSQTS